MDAKYRWDVDVPFVYGFFGDYACGRFGCRNLVVHLQATSLQKVIATVDKAGMGKCFLAESGYLDIFGDGFVVVFIMFCGC